MNALDKMYEYNLWANSKLIEICDSLDADQLTVEVKGVYGRIHPTLVHLVQAEGGYVNRLTGSRPWAEAEDSEWEAMPLSELLERVKLSGQRLVEMGDQVDPAVRHDVDLREKPYYFHNWTVMLQALYHGIEHRTQVKILLTQLGVEHPELAAWDFMEMLQDW